MLVHTSIFIPIRTSLLFFLLSATCAHSLTLYEALQESVIAQPEVQAKGYEVDAAQKMSVGSIWQMGPSLSLSTNRDFTGTRTLTTRVQQPLFTGGRILNGIKESRAKRDIAESEYSLAEQQSISKISSAYLELGKLQIKKRNSQENLREHQRLFDLINRRAQAGISSENDVTTARVRLKQAESELSQTNAQLSIALSLLSELIGRPIKSEAKLNINLSTSYSRSLTDTEYLAINASPSIQAQRHKITASEAKSAIDRSNLLPQVYLRHEKYDRSSASSVNNSVTQQTFVVLEYQLGGGPSSAYAWQASVSQQQSASSLLASAERDLRNNVAKFWNQYQSSSQQVQLIKEQEQAANEVVNSFLRQYSIGKKTWLDVLNSQREAYQTRNSLVDTQVNQSLSYIELLILTGELKSDTLESIR
jgi:adhesin transport system outer membrane protein